MDLLENDLQTGEVKDLRRGTVKNDARGNCARNTEEDHSLRRV